MTIHHLLSSTRPILLAVLILGVTASQASAILTLFEGADPGVSAGGARPNSDAAAAAFQSAAGSLSTIDFEAAPLGNFGSLGVAPGVTVNLSGTDSGGGIRNDSSTSTGYNTTTGGSQFLGVWPLFNNAVASATFLFASPIDAFGAYLTGLGTATGALHVMFDDGSLQDISITGSSSGGVQFFGFTDPGASIISVALELLNTGSSRDIFGVDDVQFASSNVPETGTTLFCLLPSFLGLFAADWVTRRQTRKV